MYIIYRTLYPTTGQKPDSLRVARDPQRPPESNDRGRGMCLWLSVGGGGGLSRSAYFTHPRRELSVATFVRCRIIIGTTSNRWHRAGIKRVLLPVQTLHTHPRRFRCTTTATHPPSLNCRSN